MEGMTLHEHFATLEDPRVERTKHHQLLAIITIALCAVICGADTWVDIEEFGKAKRAWLETFLELPNGIPSHDTFGRIFARLDPEQFQACFLSWVQAINTVLPAQQIAIDGKTARRSHDRAAGKAAIQTVSAWASQTHLVLAQRHVKEHSNEQTALPLLLEQLELAGCIVSIDAMGCLPKIAKQIKEQDGEYVLALKANQGTLYQDVVDLFTDALSTGFADLEHDTHASVDKGHGRLEHRQYWTISDPACIAYLNAKQTWTGLRSIGMVEAERTVGEQVSTERRYSLTSLPGEARAFGGSKMACIGCSTSRFKKIPVACARTIVSRTLSSCDIWYSICSNRNRQPSVASKPGGSKLDGVMTTFAESSLLEHLDAIALGLDMCSFEC